jgi:Iap family predicted aminopeptidase
MPAAARASPARSAAPGRPAAEAEVPAGIDPEVVDRIISTAVASRDAHARLAYLTDRIGHRLSGSESLTQAVTWAVRALQADRHERVRAEPVMVPHWVRGSESAQLVRPVARPLRILGLGGTVATARRGLRAEVLVVESFEELEARRAEVRGKIVLFHRVMREARDYGDASDYRTQGAVRAARLGAVGVLLRSLATRSLGTPHTGALRYEPGVAPIPAAALSTEDADLLARLSAAGDRPEVLLRLGARTLRDAPSANVVAELVGRERPQEIVLLGAHLDSWDVGQGAHDDGAGCVVMMEALDLLRQLGLRPRRTVRVVLFTNEENGLRGARAYAQQHAQEVAQHVAAIESDSGGFAPRGFAVEDARLLPALAPLAARLAPVTATELRVGHTGADLIPLAGAGVPALGLWMHSESYFDYHHSEGDTLDKVEPEALARSVAAVAAMAYMLAEMPGALPRIARDTP